MGGCELCNAVGAMVDMMMDGWGGDLGVVGSEVVAKIGIGYDSIQTQPDFLMSGKFVAGLE
jgi:hypothetical protein